MASTTDSHEMSARDPDDEPGGPLRRDRVIEWLCEAYARDAFGTEELERRLDRANRAHTGDQLRELLSDLDVGELERGGADDIDVSEAAAVAPLESASGLPRVDASQVPDRQLSVGIWSGHVRRGGWIPARRMSAVAVMGGVELDFREALFGPAPVELRAVSVMGGIHLIVPPELRVETSGFAIMGGFEDHTELSSASHRDVPTLRVNGFALMGGVSVEVRRAGESAREARRRRKKGGGRTSG